MSTNYNKGQYVISAGEVIQNINGSEMPPLLCAYKVLSHPLTLAVGRKGKSY